MSGIFISHRNNAYYRLENVSVLIPIIKISIYMRNRTHLQKRFDILSEVTAEISLSKE